MNEHRVLGGAVLVLAVLLVANPFYLFEHPDEVNEVKVGNTYDRTPVANYSYDDLSPRGKEVVREAIESADNSTRFHGDDDRPAEFEFAAPSNRSRDVAGSVYRIGYNGTNYTVVYTYRYSTEVSEVTLTSRYDGAPTATYTFGDLSPRAKEEFRRALNAHNNTTRFQGAEKRPDEFEVPTHPTGSTSGVVGAVYRVEYEGTNYTIETFMPPRVSNTETRRSQALVAYGLVLAVIGSLFVWREQPRSLGLTLGGFGVVFLLANVGYRYAPDQVGWLTVFGSSIFVVLTLLGGIVSTGYLLYRTNRERRLEQRRGL